MVEMIIMIVVILWLLVCFCDANDSADYSDC